MESMGRGNVLGRAKKVNRDPLLQILKTTNGHERTRIREDYPSLFS